MLLWVILREEKTLEAFPSPDLHSTDLHWKTIRKLLQVSGVAERYLCIRAKATLCRVACHNLDSSDTQPNYCSPAASAGVTASGCPLAWILLATSKKQKDNGTVHFKAANEFSGVDVMLLSCPSSVWGWWAWVVPPWGEQKSNTVIGWAIWLYNWMQNKDYLEHSKQALFVCEMRTKSHPYVSIVNVHKL